MKVIRRRNFKKFMRYLYIPRMRVNNVNQSWSTCKREDNRTQSLHTSVSVGPGWWIPLLENKGSERRMIRRSDESKNMGGKQSFCERKKQRLRKSEPHLPARRFGLRKCGTPRLVLLYRPHEVFWTTANGSRSQRTNNIVYLLDGSRYHRALEFVPRGWECMIHDAGDMGLYSDPLCQPPHVLSRVPWARLFCSHSSSFYHFRTFVGPFNNILCETVCTNFASLPAPLAVGTTERIKILAIDRPDHLRNTDIIFF